MLKIFEYQCNDCKQIMEDFIDTNEVNEEYTPKCIACSGETQRIVSRTTFKLTYDPRVDTVGWAYDGYATSQYWKDVKAARERGEDVVPATENNKNYDPTDLKNK